MLRQSGCLFGKFSALLTSHTAAPAVSASVDELVEIAFLPAGVLGQEHRIVGLDQLVGDRLDRGRVRRHRRGLLDRFGRRQLDLVDQRVFLQRRVVAHVDRALRLGHHDRVGAREALRHAVDRGRLVVPLGVVADRVALHQRGVGPVDVRAAARLVHRAGGAHDEDRHPVEERVVDRHAGVQQADEVVQDHDHRLAGRLGVAVRDLHRDFLVVAEHHRRFVVAVVDQRVVQAAEARAGIERDVGKVVPLDHVDDHVGLPAGIVLGLCVHRNALCLGVPGRGK